MTIGDLSRLVNNYLDGAAIALPTPSDIRFELDQAQCDLNIACEYLQGTVGFTGVTATMEYEVPTRLLWVQKVSYDGTALDAMSVNKLRRDNSGWESASDGTPSQYYLPGAKKIGLVPAPDASGGRVSLRGVLRPAEITVSTDAATAPEGLPDSFHRAIARRAAFNLLDPVAGANPAAGAVRDRLLPLLGDDVANIRRFILHAQEDEDARLIPDGRYYTSQGL